MPGTGAQTMLDQIPGDFLQCLRGFYFVAEKGSVTEAAKMMGREQPTVSLQIKRVEKQLGTALFDRSSGRMKLTAEGEAVLEKVTALFEIVKEMNSEFVKERADLHGRIVIAASHPIIEAFLPAYVAQFRRTYPRMSFHLEGGFFDTVLQKVESSEADFGIAFMETVPDTVAYHHLFETEMNLVAAKNNAFFSGRTPTLNQIAKAPLICFSNMGLTESLVLRTFSKARLKPNIVLSMNEFASMKSCIMLGMGVAILGDWVLTKEDRSRMDVIPMSRYFPKRKCGILIRRRKYLPPAVRAFLHAIKPDFHPRGA
jgi:LysR family transcriptional regulator, cyn operon transcriptional activator